MIQFKHLRKGQMLTFQDSVFFLRISKGRLWITESGDPLDHVVLSGEHFESNRKGLSVIEALEETTLLYSEQSFELLEGTQAGPLSMAAAKAAGETWASARVGGAQEQF